MVFIITHSQGCLFLSFFCYNDYFFTPRSSFVRKIKPFCFVLIHFLLLVLLYYSIRLSMSCLCFFFCVNLYYFGTLKKPYRLSYIIVWAIWLKACGVWGDFCKIKSCLLVPTTKCWGSIFLYNGTALVRKHLQSYTVLFV